MENQQETLRGYIAGLFEGEGCVGMHKLTVNGSVQYRATVQLTNTEPEIIKVFVDFLKAHGWSYHVRSDVRKGRKICYQVAIGKAKDRLAFLELLFPLFVGKKVKESEIIMAFLRHRVNLYQDYAQRGRNGRYKSGCKSSFTPEQVTLYEEYRATRDSPETTRDTPITFG